MFGALLHPKIPPTLVIATGEERRFANPQLTIGAVQAKET
jgi:hypothetical protein